jgi:drug/metabolite transporter (DMT)-like permease
VSLISLSLVIFAAILHAGWNLILKQVEEKFIVTWWSVLASAVLLAPAVAAGGWPAAPVWPLLVASAAVEAIYMGALAAAYNLSDFSLVYPLARGAAPPIVALGGMLLFREHLTPAGWLAVALIAAGVGLMAFRGGSGGLARLPTKAQADALRRASSLDRRAIQARARFRFSANRMASEYVAVYRRAVAAFRRLGAVDLGSGATGDGWTTLAP